MKAIVTKQNTILQLKLVSQLFQFISRFSGDSNDTHPTTPPCFIRIFWTVGKQLIVKKLSEKLKDLANFQTKTNNIKEVKNGGKITKNACYNQVFKTLHSY